MKKIISFVMIIALAFSILTVTLTASAASDAVVANKVVSDGNTLSMTNGIYYTNKEFVVSNDTADGTYVQMFDIDEVVPTAEADIEANGTAYTSSYSLTENKKYAFVSKFGSEYGAITIVVYDTVAPVIDLAKVDEIMNSDEEFGNYCISASEELKLPISWVSDPSIVSGLIKEDLSGDEKNDSNYYKVELQACRPTSGSDGDWGTTSIYDNIDVCEVGSWLFRISVSDLAGNTATTNTYRRWVMDRDNPTISLSSSTKKKASETGISAGAKYSIPSLSTEDVGSTVTTYYKLQKKVDGNWVTMYDSAVTDFEIAEEYKDYASKGYLTPGLNEITEADGDTFKYIYQIVYTAKDAEGHQVEEELVLPIRVIEPTKEGEEVVENYKIWKIVLIVIACLAAVGIVVLLIVKPKEPEQTRPVAESDKQ